MDTHVYLKKFENYHSKFLCEEGLPAGINQLHVFMHFAYSSCLIWVYIVCFALST